VRVQVTRPSTSKWSWPVLFDLTWTHAAERGRPPAYVRPCDWQTLVIGSLLLFVMPTVGSSTARSGNFVTRSLITSAASKATNRWNYDSLRKYSAWRNTWKNTVERECLEDESVDERMILKQIFGK